MTKRQWAIIAILALAVVCVFCTAGALIVQLPTPTPTRASATNTPLPPTLVPTNTPKPTQTSSPTITPLPPTATSTPTATPEPPTPTSSPLPTATPSRVAPTTIVTSIPSQQFGGIATANLNVRTGPGTNYQIVRSLKAGESISIIGKSADSKWWKFDQGWVSAGYIQTNVDSSAVPVITSVPPLTAAPKVVTGQTQPLKTSPIPVPPVPSDGVSSNPWGYNFTCCNLISSPPVNFCNYFNCINNFWNGVGYVIQCKDGMFSRSGGRQGSCSYHGGNNRPLYAR